MYEDIRRTLRYVRRLIRTLPPSGTGHMRRSLTALEKNIAKTLKGHSERYYFIKTCSMFVDELRQILGDHSLPEARAMSMVGDLIGRLNSANFDGPCQKKYVSFRDEFVRLYGSHKCGLFQCNGFPDLPATNNSTEASINCVKSGIRHCSGRKCSALGISVEGLERFKLEVRDYFEVFTKVDVERVQYYRLTIVRARYKKRQNRRYIRANLDSVLQEWFRFVDKCIKSGNVVTSD